MDVFLLTRHSALAQLFKAVLKTVAVLTFPDADELLASVIEQSHRSKPTVVAIDLGAPMNVPNFVHFLRLSSATAHMPVIGVGELADYEALEDNVLADFNAHLMVPFKGPSLAEIVKRCDHRYPIPHPKFLPAPPNGLRSMFSKAQLRKQIRIFRRRGLSLADHAFALDARPGSPDYAVLQSLWADSPSPS